MPGAMRRTSGSAWAPERRISSDEMTKAAAATSARLWLLRETEVMSVLISSSRPRSSMGGGAAWLLAVQKAARAERNIADFMLRFRIALPKIAFFIFSGGVSYLRHQPA